MLFEKNQKLKLTNTDLVKRNGLLGRISKKIPGVREVGLWHEGSFLHYAHPLSSYYIRLKKARKFLRVFEKIGALVFAIGFIALFFWTISNKNLIADLASFEFWFDLNVPERSLFWLGLIAFCYFIYRSLDTKIKIKDISFVDDLKKNKNQQEMIGLDENSMEMKKMQKKYAFDISEVFTLNATDALEMAFSIAEKNNHPGINSVHIFRALLDLPNIRGIFLRLALPVNSIKKMLDKVISEIKEKGSTTLSEDAYQIIFHSYLLAKQYRDHHVRETEILIATVGQSEFLQELLYDLEIDQQKLVNVVEWVRVREHLREQYQKFRKGAAQFSKYGMDRAMTAVATPFLNSISQDITIAAKYGQLSVCVAREKEIDEIYRIIKAGRQSVILVGEQGVGRMAIIEGIAQRMLSGDVPDRLKDKRLVQISTSALVAGTTVAGAQERVIRLMNEVSKAKNIILFINNLHDLTGMTDSAGEGLDITETLAEYLGPGRFLTLATTTNEGYNRYIVNSSAGKVFTKVEIGEMDTNQAIQVLESKVGGLEHKHHVFFSYASIEQCVELAKKFFHDQNLPESALSLMSEVASFVQSSKGENQLVTAQDVGSIVAAKTGVPATSITEDESSKLLRLEDEMHKRVIGQDEAVISVANALRRARAEVRSQKRPIANFLFLGPTGVGKTELAKTIADVYFGGENRMIRIDMSEYQDKSSIYRLIGQPGQQGTGLLTEAVRQNPFSLLLLDELEKADPNILNLFLQVFDDGRLTDSVGRVIDFTNTIIIATSNAGTSYVQKRIEEGVEMKDIREEMIRGELKQYYRPEFLNRFDGVILFKSLNRDEIKLIAGLMLKRVGRDLEIRGVGLKVEDAALESLAEAGYDPEFGARPMRRAIQDLVENRLAELILEKKLNRRDVVVLGKGVQISIER